MHGSVGVGCYDRVLAQWGLIEFSMKVLRPALHSFALLACLVLTTGCDSIGTSSMRLTRAQAQLRFADVEQLAERVRRVLHPLAAFALRCLVGIERHLHKVAYNPNRCGGA